MAPSCACPLTSGVLQEGHPASSKTWPDMSFCDSSDSTRASSGPLLSDDAVEAGTRAAMGSSILRKDRCSRCWLSVNAMSERELYKMHKAYYSLQDDISPTYLYIFVTHKKKIYIKYLERLFSSTIG